MGDIEREHPVIEAQLLVKGVNNESLNKQALLSLTLINSNESIAEINENSDVVENYLRVKAAEAIEENMKKAEKNQFAEASKGIDEMISAIENNKRARP